jgi:hypothetical protein
MAKPTPVQRLRNLNSLLSVLHPSCEAMQTVEILKAVEFYILELEQLESEQEQVSRCAEDILRIHAGGSDPQALCFWTISGMEQELLWLRAAFLDKLESVRQFQRATVVVFGLDQVAQPEQKYWTQKCEAAFNELRDYLDQVAAGWQPKGCHLNLIYL